MTVEFFNGYPVADAAEAARFTIELADDEAADDRWMDDGGRISRGHPFDIPPLIQVFREGF